MCFCKGNGNYCNDEYCLGVYDSTILQDFNPSYTLEDLLAKVLEQPPLVN